MSECSVGQYVDLRVTHGQIFYLHAELGYFLANFFVFAIFAFALNGFQFEVSLTTHNSFISYIGGHIVHVTTPERRKI